jgi:dTDP-4-dehydrorhamnose reductase
MRILITGSNGLLGQKLVHLLKSDKEVELIATARGENRLHSTIGYTFTSMDICDAALVKKVIEETKPEVIIHTAAMTNVDQCETDKENCWQQNVYAVQYLLDAAKDVNAFFLHLSTDFIFDGAYGPYSEEASANPISFYGWSKYAAENLVKAYTGKWAIARTVLVYGIAEDMSRSNIVLWVKKSLEDGKTIKLVNDQWRTPTLAEDLAVGCTLIAKAKAEGIFNVSGEELLNPYQMASITAEHFGLDKNLIQEVDGSLFTQTAKRPPKTGFNISKIKNLLGYQPHTFLEGIKVLEGQMG